MDAQMEVVRYLHWESHLVKNMDLREAPLVIFQVEKLGVQHSEILFVQKLYLR